MTEEQQELYDIVSDWWGDEEYTKVDGFNHCLQKMKEMLR